MDLKVCGIDVIARTTDGGAYDLVLTPPGGTAKTVTVNPDPTLDGANHYATTLSPAPDIGRAPSPVGVTPPTVDDQAQAGKRHRLSLADGK